MQDATLVKALRPAHWSGWLEINARARADRIVPLPAAIAKPAGEVARFAQRLAGGGEAAFAIGNWLDEAIDRAGCGQDSALAEEVEATLGNPDIRTAQMLRKRTGIGQRQLAGLCDRNFGFTPNLLLRRARFLRSFAAIEQLPWGQWTGAIDPAYFDQSHFIRDCHRFLGTTPSRFLARQSEPDLASEASSAA
ncbi:MAG: hypothetical protein AB7F98_12630 [Novosphingobium sp.]